MLQSFSTNTGTPRCFSRSFLSGTSFQPSRLGAKMTVPSAKSTAPGRADADAGHLLEGEVGFVHRVLHAAGDALDDGFDAALGLGAELGGADAFQRVLEDAGEDLGAARDPRRRRILLCRLVQP